jgi:DNA-binding SARP family transcriptional activator
MEFRVLGPLEVAGDDGTIDLGGVKQRSVLAMFVLHAGEVVSKDRLVDALWGASPPLTAAKTVQVYVSRLRKELGGDRLVTRAPGYVLYLEPGELDLARFEALVAKARHAPPETAAKTLDEALALWRGAPLADLEYEQFAQPIVARLEEMRLGAVEQRLEAKLALGHHGDLVAELETLVAEHPLRERFRHQLMLALYRCDRQADALEAYRVAREELIEELGLEPSESLKRLEAAILRQDRELAAPVVAGALVAAVAAQDPGHALLIAPTGLAALDELLAVATPLAKAEPARELIVATVVESNQLADATARLGTVRETLMADDLDVRAAAFSSPDAGEDLVRLVAQEAVDLLLVDSGEQFEPSTLIALERVPCDVGLVVRGSDPVGPGAVVVPFGAGHHDWTALELGAWFARATGAPLRLVGTADRKRRGRDASRLLADASLIVQRVAGLVAEPVLTGSGPAGVAEAASGEALLVVGFSERWREEGLGRARAQLARQPPAPTIFVRRGTRPGGLAPDETRTRFSWSMAGSAAV